MNIRFPRTRFCVAVAIVAICGENLTAHQHDSHHALANGQTAVGIVFEDINANGVRDEDEPGLANIKVSNGKHIVKTDQQGKYSLPVTDDTILFVIKPRNWMTPVDSDNLPQFYYIHKPNGSPKDFQYPGVEPTGPLPESVDFPLTRRNEPDQFKALLFGDTQPRNIKEVEYMAHDVIEQIIAEDGHGASFGVTLGDIVFDDLSVMPPLNQAIALIGIPWYNVIGNHDINYDAPNDRLSDETFESHYGPNYYSFDHGPTHFLVLDDVTWVAKHDGQRAHYHGGLGEDQLTFIRNDLAMIPEDQLVVLMMHIPLQNVDDRQDLYRLIEKRPATVSISAHTHYMEHVLIGDEDGWQGPKPHHHIINVTVCGSWWRGQPDERGIPHATMSDGAPNGYSIMSFDGQNYSLEFRAASRPAEHQMNIYLPEQAASSDLATTVAIANVFAADANTQCQIRVNDADWSDMDAIRIEDPAYVRAKQVEEALPERTWIDLPKPHATPHMFRGMLPTHLPAGTHRIEVKAVFADGREIIDHRIMRVE
ncbi:calcineurin-like phosphoesterase C-terminal domain-containing protein [Crateriforma conspicua]|uniref:Calcineurin-like phosphoesterase n=1 Tax=Crateriforma conspicua TaxID=2527996 RepID=A0A5C5Y7N4_9PLAN|nr:calcineurin-like phosphoesterase family protein [Crateriforma conspicua]QDV65557.1 Calcineurin-like phosphoesterase [Crateriforma conspicua]TWT70948.1 Calcineurin-like phosphoesterase [Crateriforma conspicua]